MELAAAFHPEQKSKVDVKTVPKIAIDFSMKDFSIFHSKCKLAEGIRTCFLCKENEIPYCVAGSP